MSPLARNSLASLLFLSLLSTGLAQEWPRFRGPNGSGISLAKTVPTTWTDRDFNWKLPLPAAGHSSRVLRGDKIFLTTDSGQGRRLKVTS